MNFRTEIEPLDSKGVIKHNCSIMMLGSCFTDNVGERLQRRLFDVDINPFGTTFNPLSIASNINRIIDGELYQETELFKYNEQWHSEMHHSSFSSVSSDEALRNINFRLAKAHSNIGNVSTLIITWGTAYVFTSTTSGRIVNNCHKQPAMEFERRLISIDEIVNTYTQLIERIIKVNSKVKIIFTVSPIRHIADGIAGNQLSKSVLRVASSILVERFKDTCIYFPSYEIMLDDLRDYRFYASDMLHPSELAIDYIYEKFSESFFDATTEEAAHQCSKLYKRLSHRFMTDDAEQINTFKNSTRVLYNILCDKYPYLSMRDKTKYDINGIFY
ncbi:MAG: GSCFA domain-containing protein [Muribaculaceae bacterium]|nr:GSCFA domain-containing protein [Muribaculaceae bacterium]